MRFGNSFPACLSKIHDHNGNQEAYSVLRAKMIFRMRGVISLGYKHACDRMGATITANSCRDGILDTVTGQLQQAWNTCRLVVLLPQLNVGEQLHAARLPICSVCA